jgi:glutathione S-transferase
MEALAIVTSMALMQVIFFAMQVGGARQKHGVDAPKTSGSDEFERHNRVHQNTMEQLIVILPAMWMFAYFVDPHWAAGIGLIFIFSRLMYRRAYLHDPKSRGLAFGIGIITQAILLLGSVIGAAMSWVG